MKLLFLILLAPFLNATVNEPLRFEITSGYRNDRIHWHLQDPGESGTLTYSEKYRDVEYWENGLVLKVIHRDLTFFIRGAYGTFGRGNLKELYANRASVPTNPQFQFQTNGWTADGSGYFGYAVNLTEGRTYKVILTPLIGYCGYFERLTRKNGTPSAVDGFSSNLPNQFKLSWNGVLFGLSLLVEPGGPLVCQVGYSYHLMHNNVHTNIENTFAGVTTQESVKTSSGGNGGQSGWAQMDFLLKNRFRIGIGGQIHYFSTRVVDASIRPNNQGDFSEKFKLRWTSMSGWGQISRSF